MSEILIQVVQAEEQACRFVYSFGDNTSLCGGKRNILRAPNGIPNAPLFH